MNFGAFVVNLLPGKDGMVHIYRRRRPLLHRQRPQRAAASSRLELVPVNAPCLCFNGSACYDYQAHRLLWEQPMGFDAQRLIDAAVAFDPDIEAEVQTAEGHFMRGQPDQRAYFLQTQGVMPHFGELPPQPWMKLVFCVPSERTAAEAILIERPDELPPQTAQRVQRLWDFLLREAGDSCYVTRSRRVIAMRQSRREG